MSSKVVVKNVAFTTTYDLIQLYFENARILQSKNNFEIVNHEEIINAENKNERDIILEYSNENGKNSICRIIKFFEILILIFKMLFTS